MQYQDPRAAEARRLRTEEGWSSTRIREHLKVGNDKLTVWLKNLPPPEWTKRPNVKARLRDAARQLRLNGSTYDEIAEILGVSKSSVSLWARDISRDRVPAPGWSARSCQRRIERQDDKRAKREIERHERRMKLKDWLEPFDDKHLFVAALVAYWCEGAKHKPWRAESPSVQFINSDPALVKPFLRFLEHVPITHGGPTFRIHIHESASEGQAKAFWAEQLDIGLGDFQKTVWKRHNPKTVRKNVADGYHGCLLVQVRCSTELYRYIEDMAVALLAGLAASPIIDKSVVEGMSDASAEGDPVA